MKQNRIFVEKKPAYQSEAQHLKDALQDILNIRTAVCRQIIVYDIFDCDAETLELAKQSVFQEQVVDQLSETLDISGFSVIAYEALDGQYDQRSDSAMQCIKLLNPKSRVRVKSGMVVLVDLMPDIMIDRIKAYLINPVEMKEKDLEQSAQSGAVTVTPMASFDGFITYDKAALLELYETQGFAMSFEDLQFVQNHFKGLNRDPKETELKVLDTYWSDHCRHTTFNTEIDRIEITSCRLKGKIEATLKSVTAARKGLNRTDKPLTLMELATLNARLARLDDGCAIEESDEVNACSIIIDVDHDGVCEPWLLMFKNETHNHPTEIEPYGGASTCIGGAIRDPLSGRAYVYQAMRLSGCADVLEPIEKTLEYKLPQSVIAKRAADGYSGYGNQIGLTTTYVHEIYHPSYVAKHLECGAVVGAVRQCDVIREEPKAGDVIILLGGRTGRDGIGGATGSSVSHKETSLTQSAAEVQKGNALEERKIQRLFRNSAVTQIVKRCNDFGAGGVSVAIGELADGLDIDLSAMRLKYEGLNPTEIAISESQERMAVVVDPDHVNQFIEYATQENLEAYPVAEVTNTHTLVMRYQGQKMVELDRAFLNSGGVQQHQHAVICDKEGKDPFGPLCTLHAASFQSLAGSLPYASQKGLIERFDGSIGATTVLMPLAGRYQTTQNCASVQKIPVRDGKTTTCSMLSYGYVPEIFEYSPYLGGQYAIVESVAKTVAQGGDSKKIYLSLQEYFAKPGADPRKWGNVLQALLGAYAAQSGLGLAAIGGKDSMSGTYQELDVVDTLISFACSPQHIDTVISSTFKKSDSYIYLVPVCMNDDDTVDFEKQKLQFEAVHEAIQAKVILSASTVDRGNSLLAILNMALGNRIGFILDAEEAVLVNRMTGSILLESAEPLYKEDWILIGHTASNNQCVVNGVEYHFETLEEVHLNGLNPIYPNRNKKHPSERLWKPVLKDPAYTPIVRTDSVKVVIPVFPGNNCEYDLARAFEDQGASVEFVVFCNQTSEAINHSIEALKKAIDTAHIIAIPGGFSSGDEPDGSAKFIVNVLKNPVIKEAVTRHLKKRHLILGICNGFQALIKSGLLPYGTICDVDETGVTLFRNDCHHHVSTMVRTVVSSSQSPWLQSMTPGAVHTLPVSHGEGKITGNKALIEHCHAEGLIAFQYCDFDGNPSMDEAFNPNGSMLAIEGMISPDGLILGKMAHSERIGAHTFIDSDCEMQDIFRNGVDYFKEEHV